MSSDLSLRVEGLSKAYTIRHQAEREITLAESVVSRVASIGRRRSKERFWALRDVSFDVHRGEILGIIGRNGAGKSTLLKVLSRITPPTEGRAAVHGRIGSLLEVGTGFHPELTGRENVYLNGSILGMRRREIDRRFDEIVEFAGVERFLDTPVKRFSSGMYVRLAFAVAAHLDTEILVVDEVLAVGDADFQRKCLGAMGDVASAGRTVLLVSHNLGVISQLADSALLIEEGTATPYDDVGESLRAYTGGDAVSSGWEHATPDVRPRSELDRVVEFSAFRMRGPERRSLSLDDAIVVEAVVNHSGPRLAYRIMVGVLGPSGEPIATGHSSSIETGASLQSVVEVRVPEPRLAPGRYSLRLGIVSDGLLSPTEHDVVKPVLDFEIQGTTRSGDPTGAWPHWWGAGRLEAVSAAVLEPVDSEQATRV